MEFAIPEHLKTARSRHRRVPDDYAPPYPSFVARHKPSVARVVMAYFGVQTPWRAFASRRAGAGLDRFPLSGRVAARPIGTGRAISTKPGSPTS